MLVRNVYPPFTTFEADMNDAIGIRRTLNTRLEEEHDVLPPQDAEKVAQFKNHILSCPLPVVSIRCQATKIIRRCHHDGVSRLLSGVFKLLDDRRPATRLLMQDHRPRAGQIMYKPSDRLLEPVIATVDDE